MALNSWLVHLRNHAFDPISLPFFATGDQTIFSCFFPCNLFLALQIKNRNTTLKNEAINFLLLKSR